MSNTILVGAQWGDEGKGKIIDVLTERAEIVVRSQGGNNAGHTVYVGKDKYVLHLIPSGILRKGKICVIGNGVVVDPVSLVGEIDGLKALGINVAGRLWLSETAHVVLPFHRELDAMRENAKGARKLGTTKRGIGPAYGDKVARVGLRVIDLIDKERLPSLLSARIKENNRILVAAGHKPISYSKSLRELQVAADRLRAHVTNTVVFLHEATRRKAEILFEGAQGTFLDIDHGTYPFVTSSNTTAGGACTGSGVPPNRIDRVVGVMKAYTTRVGEGPLPTEDPVLGDLLHGMGREFGATTGRARRCGWLDTVVTRQAAIINGIDEIAVTNLDGLDTLDTVKVCIGYRVGGRKIDYVPNGIEQFAECSPVYVEFPGWRSSTEQVRRWKDLPVKARNYLKAVAELTGSKLAIISVGPGREQTFFA